MRGVKALIAGTGAINWFPGHMAAATKAIRDRLRVADLVLELRDSRIPISSANGDLQSILSAKRRIIALSKKDLSDPNVVPKWIEYFGSCGHDCAAVNSHSRFSVQQLLELVEVKLREVMKREPTLIVMVVGVPNVGKSALINSIHQIARSRFPVQGRTKRATVGPLPGVTQDIAGFKIAHRPSIYVLDTPGVLVPSIPDVETGLKLALAGSVKDSVVGEDRIAEYLLAVLNSRGTPLQWKNCNDRIAEGPVKNVKHSLKDLVPKKKKKIDTSSVVYVRDLVAEVQNSLYVTLSEFNGNIEDENDLGDLIELQFEALQKVLKIPHKAEEARLMVSKKFLTLFRAGKLGSIILDDVPETSSDS